MFPRPRLITAQKTGKFLGSLSTFSYLRVRAMERKSIARLTTDYSTANLFHTARSSTH